VTKVAAGFASPPEARTPTEAPLRLPLLLLLFLLVLLVLVLLVLLLLVLLMDTVESGLRCDDG